MNVSTVDIKPRHDWVLLAPRKIAEYKVMSIIIPNISQSAPGQAEVVATGPKTDLKPGDVILYNKGGGVEVMDEGEEFRLLRDLPDLIYGTI